MLNPCLGLGSAGAADKAVCLLDVAQFGGEVDGVNDDAVLVLGRQCLEDTLLLDVGDVDEADAL